MKLKLKKRMKSLKQIRLKVEQNDFLHIFEFIKFLELKRLKTKDLLKTISHKLIKIVEVRKKIYTFK